MQKKLIALAVAGLASTAAFAQTNVTIYGIVDYGYSYRFDAKNFPDQLGAPTPNSQSQLNGGQQSGNRLGFKGTEDLGNGLKAIFVLEQGFMLDTGEQASGGSNNFNRQAFAGLTGNFGTVVGGRLYTPHYTFVSGLDPFGAGTVGRYNNVYSPAGGQNSVTGGTLMDPVRVDNAIAYVSPSFGGFTVTGAFSNNAGGQENNASNGANNTVYAILGQYAAGGLTLGANYHYIAAGRVANVDDVQNFTLGGSYDFKAVKVMALYSWNEVSVQVPGSLGNPEVQNYMLGATVPFGKFDFKGSYIYSDGNNAAGGTAQQFALGLDYNLSKRTNFYTAYSFIDNDENRYAGTGDASNSGLYASDNGNLPGAWQQGFQVGLRHKF